MSEFKEPEEKKGTDDIFIDTDYNPLNEAVNEKPYTRPNVSINPEDLKGDIPEPSFNPPLMKMSTPEGDTPTAKETRDAAPKAPPKPPPPPRPEPFNQELKDASKKEAKTAAKHAALMIVDGYEMLHTLGNKAVQIPERKIKRLAQEGKLDLSIELQYDLQGSTITAGEMIQEYNTQNADLLVVTKEFKEEVVPLLTEVLEKRGFGMTVEQRLMFAFGKDLAMKGIQFASAKAIQKDMIKTMMEQTEVLRQMGGTPNPQPTRIETPRQQAQTSNEPTFTTPEPTKHEPSDYAQSHAQSYDEPSGMEEEIIIEDLKDNQEDFVVGDPRIAKGVNEEVNEISGSHKAEVIGEPKKKGGRPRKNQ